LCSRLYLRIRHLVEYHILQLCHAEPLCLELEEVRSRSAQIGPRVVVQYLHVIHEGRLEGLLRRGSQRGVDLQQLLDEEDRRCTRGGHGFLQSMLSGAVAQSVQDPFSVPVDGETQLVDVFVPQEIEDQLDLMKVVLSRE
jgi:hypothetical protein